MDKLKVLVVEDEVLIRMLIVKYLTEYNCNIVFETGYGEEAVDYIKNNDVDFICMDIKLKGVLNGIEAALELSKVKQLPIIFMSAYTHEDDVKNISECNIIGFYEKPISRNNIYNIINKVQEQKKTDA